MSNILSRQAMQLGKTKIRNWHVISVFSVIVFALVIAGVNSRLHSLFSFASSSQVMRPYIDINGQVKGTPLSINTADLAMPGSFSVAPASPDAQTKRWKHQHDFSLAELSDLATAYGKMFVLGHAGPTSVGYVGMSTDNGLTWTEVPGFSDPDDHWSGLVTTPDGRVGVFGVRVSNGGATYQRLITWSSDGTTFGAPVFIGPATNDFVFTQGAVFADSQHGLAYDLYSTSGAAVFITNNGGGDSAGWTAAPVHVNSTQFFGNQASAVPTGKYFIPGTQDCSSGNFGITWDCVPALRGDSDLAANFENNRNVWVAGGYAMIQDGTWVSAEGWAFNSQDGGSTWSGNLTPGLAWNVQQIFRPVPANAKNEVWLVGGFPQDLRIGGIIKSTDNGATWQREINTTDALYRCINKDRVVYCIGYNANDRHSTLYRKNN